MGTASVAYAKSRQKQHEQHDQPKLSGEERRALKKLRREARAAGATLATDGEGGLPPSLVLGVMRRDKFHCKKCGEQKDLSLHHKAHLDHPGSKWLKKKSKIKGPDRNDPELIATICKDCHDDIHEEDRERG